MDFTVEYTVHIDVDYIIQRNELDENSPFSTIREAIEDYVCSLDDCDYYIIDSDMKKKVFEEILRRVGRQMSLFDTTKGESEG